MSESPEDLPIAYVADGPRNHPSADDLRTRIPGWGSDLDPADRPSVPKIRFDPDATGAHWVFPERQPGGEHRERSVEHAFLTPVFGTAQPLHGISGFVRRFGYRYSEGRIAHWMLLVVGDRVDALEHRMAEAREERSNSDGSGNRTIRAAVPYVLGGLVAVWASGRLLRAVKR
jgi:hypothetical protein